MLANQMGLRLILSLTDFQGSLGTGKNGFEPYLMWVRGSVNITGEGTVLGVGGSGGCGGSWGVGGRHRRTHGGGAAEPHGARAGSGRVGAVAIAHNSGGAWGTRDPPSTLGSPFPSLWDFASRDAGDCGGHGAPRRACCKCFACCAR